MMNDLNKKNIFLWILYDFANSIPTVVFFLYFSQWLVVDHGVSDFTYNLILTVASVFLLFSAPILGSIADKNGKELTYLSRITVLSLFCFSGVSIVTLFYPNQVFLAALFFLLANYLYQFSFVFYNTLLRYIAPSEKWGTISGFGQAGNWLGQIAGLVITLPLASGAVYLFGAYGRAQTFLPATIIFFILSLPMLLFFKLNREEKVSVKINVKEEYLGYWYKFKELIKVPNMGLFLLSYFFFIDAIMTASINFPIYLQNVYGVGDKIKSMLLGSILITSAIGAFFSGLIIDKVGLKKSMMIILASWIIIFPLIGFAPNFTFFVVFTVLMGFLFGATGTATRAIMTVLCPKDKLNFGFSFYTLAERVSTLIGPLLWGLSTIIFIRLGPTRYQIGFLTMGVLIIIGFIIMRKVDIEKVS